ncbi:HU family DNA-binding protein [uncultured Bacteroides sp.]|uniref:HU family DNA-binding protein n=1 Tax=uncultured Bacteroides sp. TaxID=162156 RepID=UPI002613D779|nr:HU family DNA-binding protein [uncultured Bacteroides sp.]
MAKYVMQEMRNLHKEGETLLYPRMVIDGCCETEELVEMITKGSTLRKGEVMASLQLIADGMATLMAHGRSVRIEGIGLFTPSLSLKDGKEREGINDETSRRNAQSIEIGNINFRAERSLIHDTNSQCNLQRQKGDWRCNRSKYSPEERLALALKYLESNPTLTIGEYKELTGLSHTAAGQELKKWASTPESGIYFKGRGSHKVYVKR